MKRKVRYNATVILCCRRAVRGQVAALLSGQGIRAFWHEGVYETAAVLVRQAAKGGCVVCVQTDPLDAQEMHIFATMARMERIRAIAFTLRGGTGPDKLDRALSHGAKAAGHWTELPALVHECSGTVAGNNGETPRNKLVSDTSVPSEMRVAGSDGEGLQSNPALSTGQTRPGAGSRRKLPADATGTHPSTGSAGRFHDGVLPDVAPAPDTADRTRSAGRDTPLPLLTDEELTALLGAPVTRR